MNSHQKFALRIIKEVTNYVVGGYENSIDDGFLTSMPSHEDLIEEIYQDVISLSKEIKFCGETFLKENISKQINKIIDL